MSYSTVIVQAPTINRWEIVSPGQEAKVASSVL